MPPTPDRERLIALQMIVFTMMGGGFTAGVAAKEPANFSFESRSPKYPYSKKKIELALKALTEEAERQGLDPASLPRLPSFPDTGFFGD